MIGLLIVVAIWLGAIFVLLIYQCRFGIHLYDHPDGSCVECGKKHKGEANCE